jgi:hypothetical protein
MSFNLAQYSGRQYPLVATLDLDFKNYKLAAQTGAFTNVWNAFELPAGAIVIGGGIRVYTAFDSAGTLTVGLGDAASATRFLSSVNLKTAARTGFTAAQLEFLYPETTKLTTTIAQASGADATAGKASIYLWYLIAGRSNENQG